MSNFAKPKMVNMTINSSNVDNAKKKLCIHSSHCLNSNTEFYCKVGELYLRVKIHSFDNNNTIDHYK